ncbi:MAG TPA: efflux RND transporter periplasmic adaptor subunit [Thermoanaerobaculia bacterium]|nr:efflux RND transporter periplasmic adaptor subunit [Thermoanaerobaculia bacterium]
MNTRAWMSWIALLLPLAGCGGSPKEMEEEAGHAGEEHAGEEHEAETPEAEEGVLVVDAEVLRDLKLTTFPAELRPGGEGVTALGELKVNESAYAEVGVPIPGRVVRLIASPGDYVRRGQPLAGIQSVELGQARAQRTAAQARAELARQTVERKRGLAEERIVSRGELQRAEAAAAEAEAELRAAEASVAALGVGGGGAGDISGFTLLAPISGTVLERAAVQGQTADPSRPLFRIGDLSRLWLVAQAPERDAVRVRAGSPAEITLAALPGQKFRGEVDWVGREVDAHSRTVPVRIVLPNEGGQLKPGMFATAFVTTGGQGERVVAVPTGALQRMDDQWAVFLPRGEGRFEVRPVERGRDLGNEVAVLSGLKPGERVVVEGAFILRAEAEKNEGGAEHHHH